MMTAVRASGIEQTALHLAAGRGNGIFDAKRLTPRRLVGPPKGRLATLRVAVRRCLRLRFRKASRARAPDSPVPGEHMDV
jgi:hypothetical protein